jgi:hypothetical protein
LQGVCEDRTSGPSPRLCLTRLTCPPLPPAWVGGVSGLFSSWVCLGLVCRASSLTFPWLLASLLRLAPRVIAEGTFSTELPAPRASSLFSSGASHPGAWESYTAFPWRPFLTLAYLLHCVDKSKGLNRSSRQRQALSHHMIAMARCLNSSLAGCRAHKFSKLTNLLPRLLLAMQETSTHDNERPQPLVDCDECLSLSELRGFTLHLSLREVSKPKRFVSFRSIKSVLMRVCRQGTSLG